MHKPSCRKHVFYLISSLLALYSSQATLAQENGAGVLFRPLPLPVGVSELTAHAQASSAELFLATESQCFIRSPFGDANGWELIGGLDVPPDDRIVSLVCCQAPGGEALLVATENDVFAVRWSIKQQATQPWSRFAYSFEVTRLPKDPSWGPHSRVYSFSREFSGDAGQVAVRAWVATSSAEMVPVLSRSGRLQFGQPVDLSGGGVIPQWAAGAAGWSYTWPYASAVLWTLGPDGQAADEPFDLRDLMAPDPIVRDRVEIECVWLDESRDLLFVGTSHGLAVAEVEEESGRLASDFVRVEAAKLSTIKLIGTTAGRMWLVADSADAVDGLDGPLLMEATVGRRCLTRDECAGMTLFSPVENGDGPESVRTAVQLDDDRVVVEGDDSRLWYWTPGAWNLVPGSDTALRDLSIGQTSAPGRFPLVISDLLEGALWVAADHSEIGWHVRPMSRHQHVPAALVPDPSGQGVWSVAEGTAAGTQFGWLTFQSPHGLLHGDLSVTGGPRHIRARSLSIQLADGGQFWPVSRHGGLLLPSGENLVHAESGFQQELPWPLPEGVSLEQMLPGANSSDTAWLAIRIEPGKPQRVVRVDLAEDAQAGQSPQLQIVATDLQGREELSAVLVPDSEGYVWFALGAPTGSLDTLSWTGHRVEPFVDEAGETRDFGIIPYGDTPQLLWLAPDEGLLSEDHALFTERGVTQIPRNELPFEQQGAFRLLTPKTEPAGPWTALFPEDDARRVRTALRSSVLSSFDIPTAGTLLLTGVMSHYIDGPRGPFPDQAFEFHIRNPVTSLKTVTGQLRETSSPRPVVMWSPAGLSVPEFVVWGETDGDASRGSVIELLKREDPSTLHSYRLDIPLLGTVTHGIRLPDNMAAAEPVDFALTDGSLIAMHRRTPAADWSRQWFPAFPTELTIRDSAAGEQTYRVAHSTLPSTLPHTVQQVAVRIAPSYTRWWTGDLSGAYLAPDEDVTGVRFRPDGQAELALQPGATYKLSVDNRDPLTGENWPLVGLPVAVDAVPPPPEPTSPVLYMALTLVGILTLLGAAIGLNTAWRRGFAAWVLRRYWNVVVADCHVEAELTGDGPLRKLQVRTPRDEEFRESFEEVPAVAWELPASVRGGLLTESCGHNPVATVLVEGDAAVLKEMSLRSWDSLGTGTDQPPIITGFVPACYQVPGRPTPVHRLIIATTNSADMGDSRDTAIVERIRSSGFQYYAPADQQSLQQQFINMLATAHVVLVPGGLANSGFGDAKEFVDTVRGRDLRCRLVVFVGNAETDLVDPPPASFADHPVRERELLLGMAAAGMHVVSVGPLATKSAADGFALRLLDALLPAAGRTSQSLAQALSDAVSAVEALDPVAGRQAADSLLLFGDPSACLDGIRTYDGFLSHSHKDRAAVKWLQRFLSKRWLLWMRRRRLCRDEDDFGAVQLSREVPARLSGSRHLIVCCSRDSATSHWVQREVRYFLRDQSAQRIALCDIGEAPESDQERRRFDEFVEWIEKKGGVRDLLRPNLRGAPGATSEIRTRVRSEALTLLAPLTGIDKKVLLRQRTRMWIGLFVIALSALLAGVVYAWWKQTPDGMRYTLTQSAIRAAESGSEFNHPGLIPMGAAFGRMNDRSALERFAQHLGSKDWRSLYLANGYLSLPQPDCQSALEELRHVSSNAMVTSPRPALLASRVCGQAEWYVSAEPDESGDRGSKWIEALIDTGFLDEADKLLGAGEFPDDDLIRLRLKAGVARGPSFRFPDGFLTQLANHDQTHSVMFEVMQQLRELDWRDRLGDSSAAQLLELAVQQFQENSAEDVPPQRWQQLAAHLIQVNRRDVALNLLQHEPPPDADLQHAETWAWRGLAMQRLGRPQEAARCFANAESCADAPVEGSRGWFEWFEIVRVYALAGDWKSAFLAAGKPGSEVARFQLKCFVLELWSGGPMDSPVLSVIPTN